MRTILKSATLGISLCLLLFCSCATILEPDPIVPASDLPADLTMNEDAGRGMWLSATIRLENGEELPFAVDTGTDCTILDKSLEPKLGKRLGTRTVPTWDGKRKLNRYAGPGLYFGSTRLITDKNVYTSEYLSQVSSRANHPLMGILGMDCLKHYCIQMDFEAGKLRFLESGHLKAADLGQAFPLELDFLPFIHHAGFDGGKGVKWWLIDSGCNTDGFLSAPAFQRPDREKENVAISTNRRATPRGNLHDTAFFPKLVWSGNTYSNLLVLVHDVSNRGPDVIGLRFLARHLVTFDFPKRTMYLKQRSIGPLAGDTLLEEVSESIRAPTEFLQRLKENGQLPGWPQNDQQQPFCIYHPQGDSNCYTFVFRENGRSSTAHYRVTRESNGNPWKLQKAWRADQSGVSHAISDAAR